MDDVPLTYEEFRSHPARPVTPRFSGAKLDRDWGTGHGARVCARDGIAGKEARTLASEVLAADDEAFRVASRKSPIKRASYDDSMR